MLPLTRIERSGEGEVAREPERDDDDGRNEDEDDRMEEEEAWCCKSASSVWSREFSMR